MNVDNPSIQVTQILSDSVPFLGANIPRIGGFFSWDVITNIPVFTNVSNFAISADATQPLKKSVNNNPGYALNDECYFPIYVLDTGSKTLNFLGETHLNAGISTIKVDGVSKGTIDWYAADAVNVVKSVSIGALTAGIHEMTIKMASKNALSTAYGMWFSGWWIS